MVRAIMFEDNHRFRQSMEDYFEDSDKVYLAATFCNAEDAVKQVKKYQPDIVLMDIQMPGISGIEALKKIREASPDTKVMMLTSFDDDDKIFAAICSGAMGYTIKGNDPMIVEKAISDLEKGGAHMTPSIALKVMEMFQSSMSKERTEYVNLTKRQKQVLACLVKGMSYKMISTDLDIGYETVCDHVQLIYKKLHVNSASEAVREAIIRRLV